MFLGLGKPRGDSPAHGLSTRAPEPRVAFTASLAPKWRAPRAIAPNPKGEHSSDKPRIVKEDFRYESHGIELIPCEVSLQCI
ncbi:hypothetical protein NDU88_001375 [Pleurodeles waltl]|uniref:Uncharacterized protein n=1 Tax=Pleurodeles waltl TaxID=8319 RepID=A0AAV7U882_PLEWA|nr:hypothetical protein NDU88_001375 [Pleurodeles waltl]